MELQIKDVNATLKSMSNSVNLLTEKLKDRNFVGDKRATALEERRNLLKNMVTLTASGLVHGLLEEDKYGMLRANASKVFKEVDEINKITSELMKELAKDTPEGSEISITELAKLVNSPYRFEEIVTKDGESIKVDNEKQTLEVEGEVLTTDELEAEGTTFLEEVKNILCSTFNVIWNAIKKVAMIIAIAICFFGILVWESIRWLYRKATGLFRSEPKEQEAPQAAS